MYWRRGAEEPAAVVAGQLLHHAEREHADGHERDDPDRRQPARPEQRPRRPTGPPISSLPAAATSSCRVGRTGSGPCRTLVMRTILPYGPCAERGEAPARSMPGRGLRQRRRFHVERAGLFHVKRARPSVAAACRWARRTTRRRCRCRIGSSDSSLPPVPSARVHRRCPHQCRSRRCSLHLMSQSGRSSLGVAARRVARARPNRDGVSDGDVLGVSDGVGVGSGSACPPRPHASPMGIGGFGKASRPALDRLQHVLGPHLGREATTVDRVAAADAVHRTAAGVLAWSSPEHVTAVESCGV